jgi:hypothetical protein
MGMDAAAEREVLHPLQQGRRLQCPDLAAGRKSAETSRPCSARSGTKIAYNSRHGRTTRFRSCGSNCGKEAGGKSVAGVASTSSRKVARSRKATT